MNASVDVFMCLVKVQVCLSFHSSWPEFQQIPLREVFTALEGDLSFRNDGNESEPVVWQIRLPVGYHIEIYFDLFQLPYSEHCIGVDFVILSTQRGSHVQSISIPVFEVFV